MVAGEKDVFVLDYDGVVAPYGRENWHDPRKWLIDAMHDLRKIVALVEAKRCRRQIRVRRNGDFDCALCFPS